MPQKFWASSEDLSVDSSVDSSVERGSNGARDTYTSQKGSENGSSDGAQDNNALVRTTVGSMSLPNLPANQHASLFYLSLIEDRCKTQAVKTINATRRQEDCLPADHPEVCDLAKHLFIETRRDLLKAGIIPKELASKSLPDLQLYLRSFDALLNNIATRKNSDISIQQDYRAIDGLSLPLNRDLSASIEFSRALVRHDSSLNLSMAEQQVDPSLLSLLSLKGPIDIAQQSTYSRDFTELAILGKGGYGSVYKVRNHIDRGVYAVKKVVIPASDLEKQMQMSSHALDNKLGEVRSLAKLRHDNVVCYHHCWIEFRKAVAGHNDHSSAGISFSGCSNDAPSAKDSTSEPSTSDSTSTLEDTTSLVPGFENMQIDLGRRDLDIELADGALGHQNDDDDFIVFGNSATSNTEESHPESKKAIQKYQQAKVDFDAVLFVKMTAYPLSLEDYIGLKGKTVEFPYRNCFHTLPAVRILLAIIDGLQYVHRKGIIHQDMKPGNIFLSILEDGEPAKPSHVNVTDCSDCAYPPATSPIHVSPHIGDFGLIHDLRGEVSSGVTAGEDQIPGTPHCSEAAGGPSRLRVIPEDASGKGTAFYRPPRIPGVEMILCPKRDCYALGVIALEMVYKFGSASERIHILTDLRQNGIVPKEIKDHKLGECIMGMLQRDREERWGLNRAKEFLVDMENRLRR